MKINIALWVSLVLAGLGLLALPTSYVITSNVGRPTPKSTPESSLQFKEKLHIADTDETYSDLVRWSPKGNLIAVSDFGTARVRLIDANTGEVKRTFIPDADVAAESFRANVAALEWSPNGQLLAVAYEYDVAYVWTVEASEKSLKFRDEGTNPFISWHPRRNWLTVVRIGSNLNGSTATVSIFDLSNNQRQTLLSEKAMKDISALVWSSTGNWLATSNGDGKITIWNAHTFQPTNNLLEFPGGLSSVNILSWHPHEDKLSGAACSLALGNCQLWVWDADTRELIVSSAKNFGKPRELIWRPDGIFLIAIADNTQVWNIQTDQVIANFGLVVSASWSPDGSSLATINEDRSMSIWTLS